MHRLEKFIYFEDWHETKACRESERALRHASAWESLKISNSITLQFRYSFRSITSKIKNLKLYKIHRESLNGERNLIIFYVSEGIPARFTSTRLRPVPKHLIHSKWKFGFSLISLTRLVRNFDFDEITRNVKVFIMHRPFAFRCR